ncbi:MAG: xanthine dehydrogenase molybdopterin binding subunit [Candidatus Wallbacteria bacterium HGW-Wallbacteria-1]|jgi:xanthine dehydrogenase large subunit|uniref:Xanthine dehydrogenase molybdopterin binding subunit n=1 Tax=Candidatus Wallbacteria bacterium HGW-Wallbacteria-1 TaxID=2013854 RepID=A0A2N1PSA7_9BACT|nr:MAG: xanthine dehydrogenase molybdopterin binding subunit [Candidatus Wallbacteria bacterium HGW-Wallbacteria-1]
MKELNITDIKKSMEGQGPLSEGSGHVGQIPFHLNAVEHVTGTSVYIGSMPVISGMLHAQPVFSPVARGALLSIDVSAAMEMPGVKAVLTSDDVPGNNVVGAIIRDENLLACKRVAFVGEPLALVVASTREVARAAARLVRAEIQAEEPVLDPLDAHSRCEYIGPVRTILKGDPQAALARGPIALEGEAVNGGQEHMYLETQSCRAVAEEDGSITLYTSSQNPTEVQELAAHVLGIDRKDITVDIKRMGGGFGGKESQASNWACLAALAAWHTGKTVELILERHDDGMATGKRHPAISRYRVAFDDTGRIHGADFQLFMNCGAYADLSTAVMGRVMSHIDNVYNIDNFRVVGHPCRTNLPPFTAFRGFGVPQGVFAIETVIRRVAEHLGMDPVDVARINLYRAGDQTHYGQIISDNVISEVIDRVLVRSRYRELQEEIREFNASNPFLRRGLAMVPVKFGISFNAPHLNQGMALVLVYGDGSVSCSHGGTEMGQEVNTKVAQVVATEFGIPISRVRVESTNTKRIANVGPTAASTGSDLNGHAAMNGCEQIRNRLAAFAAPLFARPERGISADPSLVKFESGRVFDPRGDDLSISWDELVHRAYLARVDLGAHGFYATPGIGWNNDTGKGNPFLYYANGASAAQVVVDLLTGEYDVESLWVVHDVGESLNPAIDLGQVLGAFAQGMGWCTTEELLWNDKGRITTASPGTYKIPTIMDMPENIDVEFIENRRNVRGVKRSKAIGEPPLVFGEAVFFAIRNALESLLDSTRGSALELTLPATHEKVLNEVRRLKPLSK